MMIIILLLYQSKLDKSNARNDMIYSKSLNKLSETVHV